MSSSTEFFRFMVSTTITGIGFIVPPILEVFLTLFLIAAILVFGVRAIKYIGHSMKK